MSQANESVKPAPPGEGGGVVPADAQREQPPTWGGEGGAGDYKGGPVTSKPDEPTKPK